jgi:aminopeptidase N
MENWGLLTYRETNILYYPEDTPSINQQRVIETTKADSAETYDFIL